MSDRKWVNLSYLQSHDSRLSDTMREEACRVLTGPQCADILREKLARLADRVKAEGFAGVVLEPGDRKTPDLANVLTRLGLDVRLGRIQEAPQSDGPGGLTSYGMWLGPRMHLQDEQPVRVFVGDGAQAPANALGEVPAELRAAIDGFLNFPFAPGIRGELERFKKASELAELLLELGAGVVIYGGPEHMSGPLWQALHERGIYLAEMRPAAPALAGAK